MTKLGSIAPKTISNRFAEWAEKLAQNMPDYPIAYDAGEALNATARSAGESGCSAQWAGQGAPLHRSLPALC